MKAFKYIFAIPLAVILFPLMWIDIDADLFAQEGIIITALELCKSARFSLNGVLGNIENILSLILLLVVVVYSWDSGFQSRAVNVILTVQLCDVVAGFFLAVTTARRDIAL